ncbi:MAG: O-antigen ligase family protein [Thermoanaerobaculia bacterium]
MRLKTIQKLRALARASFAPTDSGRLDVAAFCLLLAVVFIAPLPFGIGAGALGPLPGLGASPSFDLLLEVCAFVIAGATLLSRTRLRSPGRIAVPIGTMIAIVALGTLQILPIPQTILRSVAPVNLKIYHETAEILSLFGRKPPEPRISIAPSATAASLLLILAYFALFFSAANLLRNRERRRLFALVFFAAAILQILIVTIGQWLGGSPSNPGRVAAYLEIALALAFGALWAEILTNRDRAASGSTSTADRFETRSLPLVGRFLLWAIVVFGVIQTGSRVALLAATTTTLAVLGIAFFHRRVEFRRRRPVGFALALLAALLFSATLAGARPLVRFLESDPGGLNTSTRVALWRTAYRTWQDFRIVGSGFGTFPEAVRRYQPRELGGRIEHARSDPSQILVTGGVVGAALVVILYLSLFALLLRSFREQPHREESALLLGAFGALLSLSIHGLMDSAYPAPVVPAMLASLVGAAWAAARRV